MARMKAGGAIVIALLIAGAVIGGLVAVRNFGLLDKIAPKGHQAGSGNIPKGAFKGGAGKTDIVKIGVVTFPGYGAAYLYNNGFTANAASRYYTEQGIKVEFVVDDDVTPSRSAWKEDQIQILWATIDAFPTEMNGLGQYDPVVLWQSDWSQGADAIVAKANIKSANDLVGKKVAFAEATPSHTFLLYALDAGDLSSSDIEPVVVSSAIEAAKVFRDGRCDAAVVWAPDDDDCVAKVPGAHILMSSKDASNIIADCFFAKRAWVEANKETVTKIAKGWMIGAAEINSNDGSKQKCAEILTAKFGEADWYGMLGKVRITTYGDNLRFFGLDAGYTGMTGEKLYTKMTRMYKMINYVRGDIPDWNKIAYPSIMQSLQGEFGSDPRSVAQGAKSYTAPTAQMASKAAVSTKRVSVSFPTGSATLDENAKQVIEFKFADIMLMSANRIRVEGNTDIIGTPEGNMALSKRRAQSVADYLSSKFNVDRNRFVVVGNGQNNPIASNDTEQGRAKNRRTDFELLGE